MGFQYFGRENAFLESVMFDMFQHLASDIDECVHPDRVTIIALMILKPSTRTNRISRKITVDTRQTFCAFESVPSSDIVHSKIKTNPSECWALVAHHSQ